MWLYGFDTTALYLQVGSLRLWYNNSMTNFCDHRCTQDLIYVSHDELLEDTEEFCDMIHNKILLSKIQTLHKPT